MNYQNRDKIAIFRSLFHGMTNVYGSYDIHTGESFQVKKPVTDKVILNHLLGKKPYGVYLLVRDRIGAIATDFDTKNRLAPIEFVSSAKHYGLDAYIERSKSKGYHVWIFFEYRGVLAHKARLVVHHILEEIEYPETEIFPKQDKLDKNSRFGNFINAPLFGSLVPKGRTVFLNPASFKPYSEQWTFLDSVKKVPESFLDEIIELNSITTIKDNCKIPTPSPALSNCYGLPPCALKMLSEGVEKYQRVSCFRLAVHFKRIGIPYELAEIILNWWAQKNKPVNGKRRITDREITQQTKYAFKRNYQGYGCQTEALRAFCVPTCRINTNHQ
jgi:hypothetical protein